MKTNFSILFYAKRAKRTTEGLIPIYLRVTIQGSRFEVSTFKYVDPGKWSVEAGRMKGNTEEARNINTFLDALRAKAYDLQLELVREEKEVTIESFKNKWHGIQEKPRMLLEIFRHHNEQMKKLVGIEYSNGTIIKYNTSLSHATAFIRWKFAVADLDIKQLDFSFITDYEFYLKSTAKCAHNTALKYIIHIRKIVNACIKNGWLAKDPFFGFKMGKKEVKRYYLTEDELQEIASKVFLTERLNQVRDIFLFSCYTGLAYADTKKLTRAKISVGIDGGKWIFTSRQKTDSDSRIPLLPAALEIIAKYDKHPQCINEGKLLPVLSNQKMNEYLKEIANCCGINKNLTTHIARHTFATTVTLSNGVPIESVSKMLGHKSIKTTQHYAKILDKKVSDDMILLKEKLSNKKSPESGTQSAS